MHVTLLFVASRFYLIYNDAVVGMVYLQSGIVPIIVLQNLPYNYDVCCTEH